MNIKPKKKNIAARKTKAAVPWKITLAGLVALVPAAGAQQVIAPPPQFSTAPPAAQESQLNDEMTVFAPEGSSAGGTPETPPFQYGILNVRPHPYYRILYERGILSNTNQQQSSLIQQVSPGILLEIGRQWSLDYTPTWSFYSNKNFRNSLDHAIQLNGQTSYDDWTFGFMQGIGITSDPMVETGTQTSQQTYTTALNASYRFNSRMSTDLSVGQNIISAPQFESSRDWSTLDWLNYDFWPRLQTGVGVGLGYVNVDTGPSAFYEQLQGRVNWRATDKISFQINGGLQDQQFIGGAGDLLGLIFGAAIQYQPVETTKFSLNASRSISQSYFQNQVGEDTGFSCDLNQRLLQKLYLDVTGGYHTIKYVGSASTSTVSRTDDFYSLNFQLSCKFLKRGNVAVFYQLSDDASTQPGFSYYSSQVGLQISYQY